MIYKRASLVMNISYPASSRIIVLLKTLGQIIDSREERRFRENRKKGIIFRSNAINKKGAKTFRCVATRRGGASLLFSPIRPRSTHHYQCDVT